MTDTNSGNTQPDKQTIRQALGTLEQGNLRETARSLFNLLGYDSERTLELDGSPEAFVRRFPSLSGKTNTNTERNFIDASDSVHIVFQITDAEIHSSYQMNLLDGKDFAKDNIKSFLFIATKLKPGNYARGKYAEMTREINKRLGMPTVVLFTNNGQATFAFIHRREHKNQSDRDVLGKVSLIRNVDCSNPHRAHLDILAELSLGDRLNWIEQNQKQVSFDGLLAAWLAKLDTEELNKRFYKELFEWFQRAIGEAEFPTNEKKVLPPENHIIRLITRMLFIWFIKEKGLVSKHLFNQIKVKELLKNYDPAKGDSYYRVILQNLFFATLNTELDNRRFSKEKNETHRNFSRYRYQKEMDNPGALLKLFKETPFINGGLFDCLDSYVSQTNGGYRIDCFSDVHYKKVSVPNRLFFGEGGLIPLFNHYKFTVEENTPAEQEVALDPELLGKVFENLLAANNPETRETARKQTGSYYTPRQVVDYMVDESLTACLAEKTKSDDDDQDFWQERLRYLLDYTDAFDDANELFSDTGREAIVRAITEITVLDPAVGSGAFPMGILHKLTLALRRIDPDNKLWEALQKEKAMRQADSAFGTPNQQERDVELAEISETFERYRDSDFGRKLYLIQNNIFGVDIQPVACQIAKLRFFISLAIEQQPDMNVGNYGIKPLPNLETKFISANTLIKLNLSDIRSVIEDDAVQKNFKELKLIREKYFLASTRKQKLRFVTKEKKCRERLEQAITLQQKEWMEGEKKRIQNKILQLPNEKDREIIRQKELQIYKEQEKKFSASIADAKKIAHWDSLDQGTIADWFDAEYMFGVSNGFDIVIGNPPYVNVETMSDDIREYIMCSYETCERRTDIYIAFFEKSLDLLNSSGIVQFIIPHSFTTQKYGEKLRHLMVQEYSIHEIVDASSYRIFENATVFNVVVRVGRRRDSRTLIRHHKNNEDFRDPPKGFWIAQSRFSDMKECRFETRKRVFASLPIKEKLWEKSRPLKDICLVAYGARLNHRSKKIGKSHYVSTTPSPGRKKFIEGANIERYHFSTAGWLNYRPSEHYNPMFVRLFESEKIVFINIVSDRLRFAYDSNGCYNSHTVINCVRLDMLKDEPHVTAVRAVKNGDVAFAQKADYKFLLGILNSSLINWYFMSFLSEQLHCYPNDAKMLPIPVASESEQSKIIKLADETIAAKSQNPAADTSKLESEIDQLVYKLYGLTKTEIAAIENEG